MVKQSAAVNYRKVTIYCFGSGKMDNFLLGSLLNVRPAVANYVIETTLSLARLRPWRGKQQNINKEMGNKY